MKPTRVNKSKIIGRRLKITTRKVHTSGPTDRSTLMEKSRSWEMKLRRSREMKMKRKRWQNFSIRQPKIAHFHSYFSMKTNRK